MKILNAEYLSIKIPGQIGYSPLLGRIKKYFYMSKLLLEIWGNFEYVVGITVLKLLYSNGRQLIARWPQMALQSIFAGSLAQRKCIMGGSFKV